MLFTLAFCASVSSQTGHLTRVVSDPVESLIYPQQILVGADNSIYILDTISNSSHVKIYSSDCEFISGLIPAGAGQDAARFDLGLTLLSGKNIIALDDSATIYLLDNEDNFPVLKSFNHTGTLMAEYTLGMPIESSAYGGIAVDGSRIYVEFNDEILFRELPLKSGFHRFTGKQGEAIDNWDAASGKVAILTGNDILLFNQNAIPTASFDLLSILDNPVQIDVFDLALSSKNVLAIAGIGSWDGNSDKPFLATIDLMSEKASIIYPEKFVMSLDWSMSGILFSLVVERNIARINRYDQSLTLQRDISIPITKPSIAHATQVAITDDGTLWLDDQYDPSSELDPFSLFNLAVLSVKSFKGRDVSEYILDKTGSERFATSSIDTFDNHIIVSGLLSKPVEKIASTPIYELNDKGSELTIDRYAESDKLILGFAHDSNRAVFLDPNNGLEIGTYSDGKFSVEKNLVEIDKLKNKVPIIHHVSKDVAIAQCQFSDDGFSRISLLDLNSGSFGKHWHVSEFCPLELLYVCDDGTAVIYWFPEGLLRVDTKFKVLGWIGFADEAIYNFIDGCYSSNNNYLLEARYNVVYSFDDSAWKRLEYYSLNDGRQKANELISLIASYYAMERKYPTRLTDLIGAGLCDSKRLEEIFEPFMGDTLVHYEATALDYSLILWGKDEDSTIFKINRSGMTEY